MINNIFDEAKKYERVVHCSECIYCFCSEEWECYYWGGNLKEEELDNSYCYCGEKENG